MSAERYPSTVSRPMEAIVCIFESKLLTSVFRGDGCSHVRSVHLGINRSLSLPSSSKNSH